MAQIVLTPNNIGSTMDITSEPGKFNYSPKVDGSTITKAADGTLSAIIPQVPGETITTMGYNPDTHELTYTNEAGTTTTVTLPILADVSVDQITDNGNGTYTFTQTNGGPSVTLDLSAMLKQVAHADSQTVALTGDGTAGSPLTAAVKLSEGLDQRLIETLDGLIVTQDVTEPLQEWGTNTLLGYVRPA